MPWTHIFKSLINSTSFVVVWFAIPKLYGASLGFRSPNLNLNHSVIILTPKPPSSNTSFIVFFPIYTWIIAIWLSIATIVVPTSSIEEPTCFFVVALLTFLVFSSFSFCHIYFFKLRSYFKQLSQVQKITIFSICLSMSRKISSTIINFSCEFTTS